MINLDEIRKSDYYLDEIELIDTVELTIAEVTNSENAGMQKDGSVLLLKIKNNKLVVEKSFLTKKELKKIEVKIMANLKEKYIKSQFIFNFKAYKFYKAIPIKQLNNEIKIKILNENTEHLYDFILPISSLNYNSILKIKENSFYENDNIIYIAIKKYDKDNNKVICSQFSENLLISMFLEILDFVNERQNKNYNFTKVTVKFNEKTKKVDFYINENQEVSSNFLSTLTHFLKLKIGKVNITKNN